MPFGDFNDEVIFLALGTIVFGELEPQPPRLKPDNGIVPRIVGWGFPKASTPIVYSFNWSASPERDLSARNLSSRRKASAF